MNLRVVTCAPDYLPHLGGAEVGLHTLLRRASETTDNHYSVVVPTDDRTRERREVIDGVLVRRFHRPHRWVNWYAPTAAGLARSPGIVRSLRPDIVHLSYSLPTGPGGALGAKLARVPYILSLGGNDVADPIYPPPEPLRRLAVAVARGASHVMCWTSTVRDVLVDAWGIPTAQISINPFGVDTDYFRPREAEDVARIRQRSGLDEDDFVVLALQRLEARKGVDVLLDALSDIPRSARRIVVLVAGEGRERRQLVEQAHRLNLEDRVRFLGVIDDDAKRELLAAADLLVLASRHEGQGIVIAEAAASATPAIATKRGGVVDMIDDGLTGLLVPGEDPTALAQAIARAAVDAERTRMWGYAARQKAVEDLSISATAQRFVDVLEGCAR